MKRYIPAIIILLIGFIFTIIGALFKIQHWPYGSLILTIGMLLKVVAICYAIILLIVNNKKSS